MRKAYTVFVIPVAHKVAGNLLMALVNGDDPAVSNSFSQGANADGSYNTPANLFELATHFYGGMPSNEAWETQVTNLADNLPVPSGGYPWNGISESAAIAAAEAIEVGITVTQNGSNPSPSTTLANALDNLDLVKIVEIEEPEE